MTERPCHYEIYRDKRGKFRWRRRAGNNRIIAVGGEWFHNVADVWKAVAQNSDSYGDLVNDLTEAKP